MNKKFRVSDYRVGDKVKLFGTTQQCIIIYIKKLKKHFVLRSDGNIFELQESHYYRIRSVQRDNKIIAKRKTQSQELFQLRS